MTHRSFGLRAIAVVCVLWSCRVELPATPQPLAPGLSLTLTNASGSDTRVARLAALYVPEGEGPTPFLDSGPLSATWEGYVTVDLGTDALFSALGAGRLWVMVNDQLVFEAEGDDFSTQTGTEVFLKKGLNQLVIRYQSQGAAFVRLFWESIDWPKEPLHPLSLSHDPNREALRNGLLQREGRELLATRRCLKCHQDEAHGMPELAMDAPDLSDVGARLRGDWIAHWILNPRELRTTATMPQFPEVTRQDAADIAAFLASQDQALSVSPPSAELVEAGQRLFTELRCIACHTLSNAVPSYDRVSLKSVKAKWLPDGLRDFMQQPDRHYAWVQMPNFQLTPEEAERLAAFLLSHPSQPEAWENPLPPGNAARGRQRLESGGCLACHSMTGLENQTKAPVLRSITVEGWRRGCMAEQPKLAPDFGLTAQQRQALLAFATTDLSALNRADAAEFAERQIRALRCVACHQRDHQNDLWTDLRYATGELQAEVSDGDESAGVVVITMPSLTWTGGKLKPEWMESFLAGGLTERPRPFLGLLRMPVFASRASLLARGLAMQHGCPPTSPETPAPDPGLAETGRQLAGPNGGLDCLACHAIGGQPPTKVFEAQGPNLKHARTRLRKDFFFRWMMDPIRVEPGTRMPQFFPEGRTQLTEILEGDTQKQIEALWQYLLEGERIRPPDR